MRTNANGVAYRVVKGVQSDYVFTVLEASEDEDNDEIPNWWESLYFGGPTNANPDAVCSNGVNTVWEAYIAGLDPTDPQSVFLTSVQQCSPQAVLGWNATSGRVYSVWWTTNLLNDFQLIESNLPWTVNSFTDDVHDAEAGFYKIDVRMEE